MRRLLTCAAIALSLFWFCGCGSARPQVSPARPSYLDAVKPMQVKVVDEGMSDMVTKYLEAMGEKFETGSYQNVCTISAIHPSGLWLTAAHCVFDIGKEGRFIDEQPMTVVFANFVTDIAIVQAEHVLPKAVIPVNLDADVRFEQEVLIVGHPFGYADVFVTKGTIANPHATSIDKVPFILFNCTAAPGNSGSPVLNANGEIISVLQIGWGRTFSPVSGGVARENLQAIKQFLPASLHETFANESSGRGEYWPTLLH